MSQFQIGKDNLIEILESVLGKTLGAVDKNNVFERTITNPKITGIAGDVVEQSIIGMPRDNNQRPDLNVDGTEIELKSTGIRLTKKTPKVFEAKEPMSVTAVSPNRIVGEDFYNSKFWHKLDYLLLVFYHYDSYETVPASEYANFIIKGYSFYRFSEIDEERLKGDWELVRNFIRILQQHKNPEDEYHRISSELRSKLLYIDTAPKWPNPPRFRLKRQFVSSIVQEHFGNRLEQLPMYLSTYIDLDRELKDYTARYYRWTIRDFINFFNIEYKTIDKSVAERIIVKMFGGESKKIGRIEFFNKANISAKTITLSNTGGRTEDMKLLPIDFEEIRDPEIKFEESSIYDYFANMQLLCIVFEEESSKSSLETNVFIGFKRLSFDDEFINTSVRFTWEKIRSLVNENRLVESYIYNKNGKISINPNGERKTSINFPKAIKHDVFVRGSGTDSSKKPNEINGIRMYHQDYWIKGKYIVEKLLQEPYL